ncbi:MAG: DMT family transporter [Chitinivibrionales bacterium]
MEFPVYLLLPFASSIIYAFSAVIFKKVLDGGVNAWFINFLSNVATCALALPLLFADPMPLGAMPLARPLIAGVIFMVGQMASVLALKQGDVSVATPLLGMKVLLVALFTVIVLHQPVSPGLWAAAFMATFAFVLLRGPKGRSRSNFVSTVLYSLLCAASFALCDILIQKWAPSCGSGKFLTLMFIIIAVLSLVFIPIFRAGPLSYSLNTWKWLGWGILFIALQAIGMGIALSYFGNATATNIVFSSRGIWSVLIVWKLGVLFENKEKDAGKKTMIARLAGSALLFAAIVLVIIKH